MTRERFDALLDMATAHTVAVARPMVVEALPDEVCYQLLGDRNMPTTPAMTKEDFVQRVWREGKIPEWIDLSVFARSDSRTHVGVILAEKFVEDESHCVYAKRGQGPFGIKSPRLPWDWVSLEKSGRFSLSRKEANQLSQPTQASGLRG
jgi:hypothetical protein